MSVAGRFRDPGHFLDPSVFRQHHAERGGLLGIDDYYSEYYSAYDED